MNINDLETTVAAQEALPPAATGGYRGDWHVHHATNTTQAAEVILDSLLRTFPIESMLDVGCGHGHWIRVALDRGIDDVLGCDGPWTDPAQLIIPPDRFRGQRLEQPLDLGRRFDLVLCTEVGEHVDERYADQLVQSLTAHSDLVMFGAAIPYQGGYRHINEQWQSWWVRKFDAAGFAAFDLVRPAVWQQPGIDFWYKQNALVYVRRQRSDLTLRARNAQAAIGCGPLPYDIVHPEKFVEIASYQAVAFRPLLRNFPGAFWRKLSALAFRR